MKKTKTNRYLNRLHENRQLRKKQPKEPNWDFLRLNEVIRQWAKV